MIPLGRRFIKIFLFIVTGLALLRVYDVDITALLAGLGVGGIAVALAAQNSLENLFLESPSLRINLCAWVTFVNLMNNLGVLRILAYDQQELGHSTVQ